MVSASLFSDHELLQKIAKGDEGAFKLIYEANYRKVYSYALRFLKVDILAEEAVQEVFLKLWKNTEQTRKIQSLDNFLFIVTRNLCFEQLRHQALVVASEKTRAMDWNEADTGTEESILLRDTRKLLADAIDKLPPQQKIAYRLCHQQGLKYEEAAREMDLSPLTVHSHMKAALKFLRTYLADHTDLAVILIILKIF